MDVYRCIIMYINLYVCKCMYMYVYAPCCNVLMLVLHAVASGFRHVHSSSTALSWYSLRLHAVYQRLLVRTRQSHL